MSAVLAVDAHNLARIRSGVEVYADNILRHLDAPRFSFRLFSDLPLAEPPVQGYEILPLPFASGVTGRNYVGPLWFHWTLARQAARIRADLLWSPYFFVPLGSSVPTVATIHDTAPLDSRSRSYPPVWRRYFLWMLAHSARHARHIIVPSQRIADNLQHAFGTPGERISVIPHGVAPEFFAPAEPAAATRLRAALGIDGRFILFVGSLGDRKNVITLVRAYAQLPPELQHECQLVIVGPGGSDEALVRGFLREAKLGGRVILAGYLEPRDLVELYKAAELLAFPSLSESFGLPVVEAMAAGTPVLTSNTSSLPDTAGDAAWLLDPTDVPRWTDALQRTLTEESLRADLRQRGLARARLYSWPEAARRHVEVFEACL
ncbi:MAG TPA: glycosyltransferase family 1 protein [Armatimonadota bacterium]|jgi:glycosyltransferase involved in cell wall biosynthesis